MKILVLNGPNMNMLGIREPNIYGAKTYNELVDYISEYAQKKGVEVKFLQSNHEGALVDAIQDAFFEKTDAIIINPAAYTHTSLAIADAVRAVKLPTVEVHLSAVNERESYRRISYIKEAAVKTISGEGFKGYTDAIDVLLSLRSNQNDSNNK